MMKKRMSKANKTIAVSSSELILTSLRIKPTNILCCDLNNHERGVNYFVVGLLGAGKTTLQSTVMKSFKSRG